MGTGHDLLQAVRANTTGTPYVVEPTPEGFTVHLDLDDATWRGLMNERHLAESWTYRVQLDESARSMTITDEVRDVRWETVDGVSIPIAASVAKKQGRFEEKRFYRSFGGDQPSESSSAVGYTFDSAEGRDLIREPARALGWTEKMGTSEKFGAIVGFGTIGLIILGAIIVGIVALAGGFS